MSFKPIAVLSANSGEHCITEGVSPQGVSALASERPASLGHFWPIGLWNFYLTLVAGPNVINILPSAIPGRWWQQDPDLLGCRSISLNHFQ